MKQIDASEKSIQEAKENIIKTTQKNKTMKEEKEVKEQENKDLRVSIHKSSLNIIHKREIRTNNGDAELNEIIHQIEAESNTIKMNETDIIESSELSRRNESYINSQRDLGVSEYKNIRLNRMILKEEKSTLRRLSAK